MKIKELLRELTPPLLVHAVREARGVGRPYKTWAEAAAAAGSYDDALLNRFRAERFAINKHLKASPEANPLYLLSLLIGGSLEIVDCGGSTGSNGEALVAACPNVTYAVLETPALVALMPKDGPVKFISEMPASFDVFYAGCTLQYLERPLELLSRAFKASRRAVVLCRTSLSDDPAIYIQRVPLFFNGGGKVPAGYTDKMMAYPHQTLRESDIVNLAAQHDFNMVMRTPEAQNGNPLPGVPIYGAQLVFLNNTRQR